MLVRKALLVEPAVLAVMREAVRLPVGVLRLVTASDLTRVRICSIRLRPATPA